MTGPISPDPGLAPLDAALRAAAATATFPATPDLRGPVLVRIELAAGPRAGSREAGVGGPRIVSSRGRVGLVRGLLVAVVILLLFAAVAVAAGFRLPGLEILFGEATPASMRSPGAEVGLGRPISLADAMALETPRVLVPAEPRFARPDAVRSLATEAGSIVSLTYAAGVDLPSIPGTDIALIVMAVPGTTDEPLLRKVLGPGSTVEPVEIGGTRGWWISGASHELLVRRDDGTVSYVRVEIAGDTLVFARSGTLYRLESALGRDRTVEIALGLR